ncbi:hypothetical protein [Methanosarcina sp. UBA289]|jgi:hypothetical protein|nr:hypothetical protein [Methanosarcina sp. UBA289]
MSSKTRKTGQTGGLEKAEIRKNWKKRRKQRKGLENSRKRNIQARILKF